VWATAAWMMVAAGLYWLATLTPNFSVFVLTDEIADRPGDGPYTTKVLMSIARGAAMPLGFASTLSAPVRRVIASGWRRPVGLVVYAVLFTGVPNLGFTVDSTFVRVATRFMGSFFFSWVFCTYMAYAQGRRASDVLMPMTTVCMLLAAPLSRALSPIIGRAVLGDGADDYAWMPVTVSAVLMVPTVIGAMGLAASPQPTEADVGSRMRRTDVTGAAGRAWLRKHWPIVLGMAASNTVLQCVRIVRDIFATDLLGADAPAWHWVIADAPACIGASVLYVGLAFITDHKRSLVVVSAIGLGAGAIMLVIGALSLVDMVSPLCFLIVSGVGYFIAVVPFAGGGVVVERLIAASRMPVDSMYVNVLLQLPGYIGALGVLVAAPLASDPAAYFGWTVLGGGVGLLISYLCTLGTAWCILSNNQEDAESDRSDDFSMPYTPDYYSDCYTIESPSPSPSISSPDQRGYGTFARDRIYQ